jgi:hypothetical protein
MSLSHCVFRMLFLLFGLAACTGAQATKATSARGSNVAEEWINVGWFRPMGAELVVKRT